MAKAIAKMTPTGPKVVDTVTITLSCEEARDLYTLCWQGVLWNGSRTGNFARKLHDILRQEFGTNYNGERNEHRDCLPRFVKVEE